MKVFGIERSQMLLVKCHHFGMTRILIRHVFNTDMLRSTPVHLFELSGRSILHEIDECDEDPGLTTFSSVWECFIMLSQSLWHTFTLISATISLTPKIFRCPAIGFRFCFFWSSTFRFGIHQIASHPARKMPVWNAKNLLSLRPFLGINSNNLIHKYQCSTTSARQFRSPIYWFYPCAFSRIVPLRFSFSSSFPEALCCCRTPPGPLSLLYISRNNARPYLPFDDPPKPGMPNSCYRNTATRE